MFDALFANELTPHADVQLHLVRVFGFGRITAALLVLAVTTFGSVLGSWLWSLLARYWDDFRHGGWAIRVSGGRSSRAWHMPLDASVVKALRTGHHIAFERDLGTLLSGDGQVDFSFGVLQSERCRHAMPQAPGLTIDFARRVIAMDFATGTVPQGQGAVGR